MNETLKRALSGVVYVAVMWIGTSYSELTFILLFAILALVSLYEMWKLRKGKTKILAFLYVIVPFSLVSQIDNKVILLIFVLTWTFDTFAYLTGVKFGKTKIMPSVSPKKSWEGFTGGFVFTLLAAYICATYFLPIALNQAIIISIFLPFTATLGDFTESYYKRKAEVKDSGNFIPGHGGMLDRMDAFMITIPILYIYLNII